MPAGPLVKKLLIKPGHRISVLNAPDGYLDRLAPLPEGVQRVEEPDGAPCDVVHLFVKDRAELERLGPTALATARRDGVLRISYPKRSSKVTTDLTRDVGWESITAAGYEGVAQVAIDETWSATPFRPAELVTSRRQTYDHTRRAPLGLTRAEAEWGTRTTCVRR